MLPTDLQHLVDAPQKKRQLGPVEVAPRALLLVKTTVPSFRMLRNREISKGTKLEMTQPRRLQALIVCPSIEAVLLSKKILGICYVQEEKKTFKNRLQNYLSGVKFQLQFRTISSTTYPNTFAHALYPQWHYQFVLTGLKVNSFPQMAKHSPNLF